MIQQCNTQGEAHRKTEGKGLDQSQIVHYLCLLAPARSRIESFFFIGNQKAYNWSE